MAPLGCKDDAASKPSTAASTAPTSSAIPDDLVVNSFFAQGKGVEVAIDGSAGFGEPGGPGAGGDNKMKVLDPGGDPKTKLAYNLVLNKTQSVVATVSEEMGGPDIPPEQGKQPTIKYTLAFTPKKKLDGGKTQVELKVVKFEIAGVDPAKVAPLASALTKITASFTVQPNGDTGDMDLDGAEGLPRGSEAVVSTMARIQSTLYVPLPPVPVGPGAKWRTTFQQADSQLDATYTLVGKTDSGWDVKLENQTIAAPKVVQDPRSGKKISINVKGSSRFTLTSLFDGPASKVNGDSTNDISMSDGAGPQRTNIEKMTMSVDKLAK